MNITYSLRDQHPPRKVKQEVERGSRRTPERILAEKICAWYDHWILAHDTTPDPEELATKLRGWSASPHKSKFRRNWTDRQIEKIKALTAAGHTYAHMAREMECSPAAMEWAVHHVLKLDKPDIKAKGARLIWEKWWTEERRQYVRDHYINHQDMTQREMAKNLGCSQKKISLGIADINKGVL